MRFVLLSCLLFSASISAEEASRFEKDMTDYALWRLPAGKVPPDARYIQMEVRSLRLTPRSPREELLAAHAEASVVVRLDQDRGPVNPIWKDACRSSASFQALRQRMYKVFGSASFGPNYAPRDGPDGKYDWIGADAQLELARRSASITQVVIGRDAPPWLWPAALPGEDLQERFGTWKRGHLRPPRDLAAYEEVVFRLVRHLNVEKKFGVHSFLAWNGTNSTQYFLGTMGEFAKVYGACARAVRRADPAAKVGGPSPDPLLDADWVEQFVRHRAEENTPLDFVSLHNYSLYADQSRRMAEWTRGLLAATPRLRDAEIHVDEWNSGFANPLVKAQTDFKRGVMSAAYAAATFGEMTEGGVAYACYSAPTEGFGLLGTRLEEADGTPLPIYNAFRLFGLLSGRRCAVAVEPAGTGIGGLATRDGDHVRVALWGYAAERQPSDAAIPVRVTLRLEGAPWPAGARTARVWRIDDTHSNLAAGKAHGALERGDDASVVVKDGRAQVRWSWACRASCSSRSSERPMGSMADYRASRAHRRLRLPPFVCRILAVGIEAADGRRLGLQSQDPHPRPSRRYTLPAPPGAVSVRRGVKRADSDPSREARPVSSAEGYPHHLGPRRTRC